MTFDGLQELNKTSAIIELEKTQKANGYVLSNIQVISSDKGDDETLLLTYKKDSSYRIYKLRTIGFNDGSVYPALAITEAKF